jgi:hypothetical protein
MVRRTNKASIGLYTKEVDVEVGLDAPPSAHYAAFATKLVRHGFIRKVYGKVVAVPRLPVTIPMTCSLLFPRAWCPGILFVQLMVTFAMTLLFTLTESIRSYVQTHAWTYIVAM